MQKVLIGVGVGIFIGALTVEILNRKKPELTRKIEQKAKNTVDAFATAFKEGFEFEGEETESTQAEQSPA
jgi:gas vesicle protein